MPEHIVEKSLRLRKTVKQILDTYTRYHRNFFDNVVGKHLMKGNQVRMELLDQPDKKLDVARELSDYYVSRARQEYNLSQMKFGQRSKPNRDEEEMSARLISGAAYNTLYPAIDEKGSKFTFDFFNESVKPALMRRLKDDLKAVPTEHIKLKDIGTVIDYIEQKQGKLDFINKKALRLEDALTILDLYHKNNGQIAESDHQGAHYYIPPHKRKKAA